MQVFLGLLLFALLGALVVALIKPRWIFRRDMGRGKAAGVLLVAIVVVIIAGVSTNPPPEQPAQQAQQAEQVETPEPAQPAKAAEEPAPSEPTRPKLAHADGQCALYGGYPIAISEAVFEQAVGYAVQGDMAALQKLIDAGVVVPSTEGTAVFMEDIGIFNGMATIRLPGTTTNLYTNVEALSCD